MKLGKDWRQFIESLNSHGVEYLIGETSASRFYGFTSWNVMFDCPSNLW
jgi:hypothetical protein